MQQAGLTSTPTPSTETLQQMQLLHQLQQHLVTNNQAFFLYIALSIPLPFSWRLALYHFFTTLPIPPLSPLEITILTVFGPWICVALVFAFIYYSIKFIRFLFPLTMQLVFRKNLKKQKKIFLELRFPSDTSKSAYATEQLYLLFHTLARRKSLIENLSGLKKTYSLEIVATKKDGIRYMLVVDEKAADVIIRSMLSYLPGIKIKETENYLSDTAKETFSNKKVGMVELKLSDHFVLSLTTQRALSEHDPIAYLTGNMTKLLPGELISFQVITTPVLSSTHRKQLSEMRKLQYHIAKREPITHLVQKNILQQFIELPGISLLWFFVKAVFATLKFSLIFIFSMVMAFADHRNEAAIPFLATQQIKTAEELGNPYEQELHAVVREKMNQHLFESSIRILVASEDGEDLETRFAGLVSSFGMMTSNYQSLVTKRSLFTQFNKKFKQFTQRALARNTYLNHNPIFSSIEMADLYHFPYTNTTRTEDLAKVISPDLPAPLILKNETDLAVIFGKNTYGNGETPVGLTDDDRSRHIFSIGQTGSGKSTIIFHMAKDDIQKGRGICVVDPHGDLIEDLLHIIPEERINDVVYFNPFDMKHPLRINLLELTPDLDGDEQKLEKEVVCESVISIFRRLFMKDDQVDAHRIEYILRNTIYTAFYVKDATIFTVYKLLTNPDFRNKAIRSVDDEHLQDFWKYEFGKAGDWQVFKMVSGVTAKVGRFLFSPIASRILEEPKSSIHFDTLLDKGKIILCNLSEGKLGEDTSHVLGTTIIAKIHLTILRRARMEKELRNPFYLYVDEFQNFATPHFTKLLSGSRKYGLRILIAEQSTTQQKDERTVNTMLANVGTVICFKTASPIDEELLLPQFTPLVEKGDILNLPRHRFYIKLGAKDPQEPFSGETLPIEIQRDAEKVTWVIAASRKNYTMAYVQAEKIVKGNRKTKMNDNVKTIEKEITKTDKNKRVKKKKNISSLTD